MSASSRLGSSLIRAVLVAGLLAAAVLVLFGPMSWGVSLVVGLGAVAASAGILLAGRVSLFGPVFYADAVRTARRGRQVIFRCLILAALLLALLILYLQQFRGLEGLLAPGTLPRRQMAAFAESFFVLMMAVQLVTVMALTPAATAGAISEERERKTLDFLLGSTLDNHEIVLGKLASRLGGIFLVVLTGLPLLSLLQLLGGVDPNLVLAGFAVTFLSAVSLGCLGVMLSVYVQRSLSAILLTYLIAASYLVVTVMLDQNRFLPDPWDDILCAGNVIVAYWNLKRIPLGMIIGTPALTGSLPALVGMYAAFHAVAAGLCVLIAVLPLRAWARRTASRRLRRAYVVGLTQRRKRLPAVSGNPMMWKELHAEPAFRFNRAVMVLVSTFVTLVLILGAAVLLLALAVASMDVQHMHHAMNSVVRGLGTLIAFLLLVGVGLRAAGSLGGERDRQTLDGLLAAPLTNHQILYAKWLGSLLSGRKLWWYLALVWLAGLVAGGLHPLGLLAVVGSWLIMAAFFASMGLWLSLHCQSTQRATVLMLLVLVVVLLGPWMAGALFDLFVSAGGNILLMGTPAAAGYVLALAWLVLPVVSTLIALVMLARRNQGLHSVSPYTVSMICVLPPVILTLLVLGAVVLGEYIRWDQGRVPPAWELFGVALSPPANLLTLTFFQEDWRGGYDGWIIQEVYNQFRWRLTAASLGLACYGVAALLLWRATCRSFPRVTGRMAERSRQAPARAGQGSGA